MSSLSKHLLFSDIAVQKFTLRFKVNVTINERKKKLKVKM